MLLWQKVSAAVFRDLLIVPEAADDLKLDGLKGCEERQNQIDHICSQHQIVDLSFLLLLKLDRSLQERRSFAEARERIVRVGLSIFARQARIVAQF